MPEPIDKTVVITGASSGIGSAIARHLAARGAKLMLAARRQDRLQELVAALGDAPGEANWQTTDVTDREQVDSLAQATLDRYGHIDVWINNAGVLPISPLKEVRVDEWEQMVDVNLKGVLYGIAAVLPHMRERKSGHIVNVGSVASYNVYPAAVVYCATKYAVRALSEGLRIESNGIVRSTLIMPGAVKTEIVDGIAHEKTAAEVRPGFDQALVPDDIARAVVYALEQPDDVDVSELIVRPFRRPQ